MSSTPESARRSVGRRDVTKWRSRGGRRLLGAQRRLAERRSPAAAIGMSRVLLGAHWFTDVLTGWAAGAGWTATIITTHRLHLTLSGAETD